jgi:hypothetical protein
VLYPTLTIARGQHIPYMVFSVVAALMVIYLHRGNIRRIVRGKESKAELPWRPLLQAKREAARAKPAEGGRKHE